MPAIDIHNDENVIPYMQIKLKHISDAEVYLAIKSLEDIIDSLKKRLKLGYEITDKFLSECFKSDGKMELKLENTKEEVKDNE